eukprot:364612-Chlamydomonas_euryale.AAC.3
MQCTVGPLLILVGQQSKAGGVAQVLPRQQQWATCHCTEYQHSSACWFWPRLAAQQRAGPRAATSVRVSDACPPPQRQAHACV